MLIRSLIPLYIGAIAGPMGGFGMVTLIPVLARSWSLEFATASLAITFYMVPFILFQIFSGSIAQIIGVRRALTLGFVVYTVGGFLTGLTDSFLTFMICRIVQGIGAAFLAPIIMATIGEVVPARHIGKAMGALGLAYTIGVSMGPLISGIIEVRYGWPGFFFFLAAVSLVAGILFWIWCRDVGARKQEGRSLLEVFPLIRQAISHPGILYLSFAAFALFLAYIGVLTFTADYMKTFANLPSDRVGLLLSLTGFSGMIFSPVAGVLGDRFGRRNVLIGGMAIILASFLLMILFEFHYLRYMAFFLLLGSGSATAWTSLNTMAVQSSPAMRNPVTAVYNVIKFSGYAFSPVLLAVFYGTGRLRAVQCACAAAIVVSSLLVFRVKKD